MATARQGMTPDVPPSATRPGARAPHPVPRPEDPGPGPGAPDGHETRSNHGPGHGGSPARSPRDRAPARSGEPAADVTIRVPTAVAGQHGAAVGARGRTTADWRISALSGISSRPGRRALAATARREAPGAGMHSYDEFTGSVPSAGPPGPEPQTCSSGAGGDRAGSGGAAVRGAEGIGAPRRPCRRPSRSHATATGGTATGGAATKGCGPGADQKVET